jgi:hypothetical protein
VMSVLWKFMPQVREDEMNKACRTHGKKRNACRILVGKPAGKRPLGSSRRRWEHNIKMDQAFVIT